MKRVLVVAALFVAVTAAALVALPSLSASSRAEAAGCICPKIYAPVICDNGRTYPNPCIADCRHAKNCVPTGDL
jgi:hypothetical protein